MLGILAGCECMLIFELMGENGSPMLVIWGPCALEGGMDGRRKEKRDVFYRAIYSASVGG